MMSTGFVMPQGIEWLYLLLWVGLAMVVIIIAVRIFSGR